MPAAGTGPPHGAQSALPTMAISQMQLNYFHAQARKQAEQQAHNQAQIEAERLRPTFVQEVRRM